MKSGKIHWTQRPENREKVRAVVAARWAKKPKAVSKSRATPKKRSIERTGFKALRKKLLAKLAWLDRVEAQLEQLKKEL